MCSRSRPTACFLALLSGLAIGGCARSFIPHGPVHLVADEPRDRQALYLQWLGVSSWIIARGDDVVVVDPFFSRPRFGTMLLSLLKLTDAFGYKVERINDVLPELPATAKLVLIGHGHYDHVMDVGYYIKRKLGRGPTYLGSTTAINILEGFKPAHVPLWDVEKNGKFAVETADGGIRVLPFASDHAPHILGIEFMHGQIPTPMLSYPTRAGEYLDGTTEIYLVDFLDPTDPSDPDHRRVIWRVFVNGAANTPKGALALQAAHDTLKEPRTNVAILCVPGWDQVPNYPESILNEVNPEHVVLSHYDDFWSPYKDGEDPAHGMKFVMRANYAGFVQHLKDLQPHYKFDSYSPKTGECLRFPYPPAAKTQGPRPCWP
jgi:beta-lactamase family protein